LSTTRISLRTRLKTATAFPSTFILRWLSKILSKYAKKGKFGIIEAIIFSNTMTFWQRHFTVAEEIRKQADCFSVLDVGGAGALEQFLDARRFTLFALDTAKNAFSRRPRNVHAIIASGLSIPFREDCFDIVVSIATLEHIAREDREIFLSEMKRVTKKKVIISAPVGEVGERYDRRYAEVHKKLLGQAEPFTAEHIRHGLPTLSELRKSFPNAKVYGVQNCSVWFVLIMLEGVPMLQLFTGLIYLLTLKKFNCRPPYYSYLLSWRKATTSRPIEFARFVFRIEEA